MSHIVITGANRGIGLELCRQFTARGDAVWALCRRASPALEELPVTVLEGVDVADDGSVDALASRLDGLSVDVLINNAGILLRGQLEDFEADKLRRQFEVNAIGPLRVTRALLPLLKDGSKVAIITSRMGSIDDNTSGGAYGYRMSKAAVNIAGVSLAVDLKPRGIAVGILHPGMVATDMTGGNGIPVQESATGLLARLDQLNLDNSGTFWHANGEVLPW